MSDTRLPGPLLFVRYAYPPNALGYCGPADSSAFGGYGQSGVVDAELMRMARSFTGAWRYLQAIAGRAGIADPLDRRVVEAYWVGNALLNGLLAHHSFHVLCVYPWSGLLTDERKAGRALHVLDQCRIRWGQVCAVHDDRIEVTVRQLVWSGQELSLGAPLTQPVTASMVSRTELAVGDWVSLHWDWLCDRLSQRQVRVLRGYTRRHLDLVNRRLAGQG